MKKKLLSLCLLVVMLANTLMTPLGVFAESASWPDMWDSPGQIQMKVHLNYTAKGTTGEQCDIMSFEITNQNGDTIGNPQWWTHNVGENGAWSGQHSFSSTLDMEDDQKQWTSVNYYIEIQNTSTWGAIPGGDGVSQNLMIHVFLENDLGETQDLYKVINPYQYVGTGGNDWSVDECIVDTLLTTSENYQSEVTAHYAPIVNDVTPEPQSKTTQYEFDAGLLADGDVLSTIGETYDIKEGLRARLGKSDTTEMILQTSGSPTGVDGYVEHVSGTLPALNGGTYDEVGVFPVIQRITDRDGDSTIFNRNFIITTLTKPVLVVEYASTAVDENGNPLVGIYGGEWTNQPLAVVATTIDSGADIAVQREAPQGSDSWNEVGRASVNTFEIEPYFIESASADGDALVAELYDTTVTTKSLSPKSDPVVVKVDQIAPDFTIEEPSEWDTATSIIEAEDELSGLETSTGGIYYMFTPSTVAVAPNYTDSGWSTDYATAYGDLGIGEYHLWVYVKDNATNKSAVERVNTSGAIKVLSSLKPVMAGQEKISGDSVDSGDWANETLNVKTTKPNDSTNEIPTPNYIKVTSPADTATSPNDGAVSAHTTSSTDSVLFVEYSEETDGIDVTGVLIDTSDGTGIELTQKGTYTVRIDKTNPTAGGDIAYVSGNTYEFDDISSNDNPAANGAVGSGIATGSTKFVAVAKGASAPSDYNDYNIDLGTNDLTSLGSGTFDIYTMVKDIAGNVSSPKKSKTITITGTTKATLSGAYSVNTTAADDSAIAANDSYTSGTWSNVPITLTGGKGTGSYTGDHNVDINVGGSAVATGAGNVGASVNYSANAEGITSYDSLVVNTNLSKEALSLASEVFVVKIDTKAPISDLESTDNWVSITDNSIDDTSVTVDVSEVYKTYVKYVLADAPVPTISDIGWIDVETGAASLTSAGVWDVYAYSVDGAGNKSAVKNEDNDVEVASVIKPLISAVYTAGATNKDGNEIPENTPYDGKWTNDSVDIMVATGDTASDLYGALYVDGVSSPFGSGVLQAFKYTYGGYATQSANTAGTDVVGKIAADAALSVLSPSSDALNIKIDTTAPEAKATFDEATCVITNTSSDSLSGVDASKTKVAIVAHDAATPIKSDFNNFVVGMTIPQDGGYYDIYMMVTDNAGNESAITKVLSKRSSNPTDTVNPNPPMAEKATITGNDFTYGISQVALSDGLARLYANANAMDKDGNDILATDITVDVVELDAINTAISNKDKSGNPFTLTFTEPSGEKISVQVTLKDNGNGPEDEDNNSERIVANDCFYGIDQGALDADDAKLLANVEAVDKDGAPIDLTNITTKLAQLSDINDAIQNGKVGNYLLTFTTPSGVGVEINVTLKSKGDGKVDSSDSTNPNTNTDRIAGNDFIYGINEGELSEAEAKIRAQVEAVDKGGKEIPLADIVADATELTAINDAIAKGATGNYPLTYKTDSGARITVTVNLKDNSVKPDVDPHDDEKTTSGNIGANNFIVGANEANTLTAGEAKLRSHVVAKDAFGNEYPLSVISVNTSELQTINNAKVAGQTGEFPLTFTSPEGKRVTITVRILKKVIPPGFDSNDSKNEGSIGANDFNYGRNEGSLSGDKAKELASVTANDKDGNKILREEIKVDQAQLDKLNEVLKNGETGTFPLTFTESGGKKVTVDVTIYDAVIHNEDPNNQQEFGGNDFKHDTEDGKLTEDKVKELAEIYAKDELGLDIPWNQIHVDKADLDKLNGAIANGEAGEFELKFTTDDGQKLTVKVSLFSSKDSDKSTPIITKVPGSMDQDETGNKSSGNRGKGNGSGNRVLMNNYISVKSSGGVKTGDVAMIGLWIALVLATGGMVIVAVIHRRKRQQQ